MKESLEISLFNLIEILGSLAFFIFGMKMMSDGIQRAAGESLRNILRTMTKNRFLGVLTGIVSTVLIQSSSATTVITVSFVNAGLLTLVESAGIMMGANIGTTITGWIVSILGFKIQLGIYSIPLFAIGVPILFSTRGKYKYWGEFIVGFAILFLGLSYLKNAVPDIENNTEALAWLQNLGTYGFFSRLLFVFLGALLAIIVQSSSAAMTITLTLVFTGWLPFEVAAAMILGENIGTTLTAEVAALVGNVDAKRSARIHSLFNIFGVSWMLILMPVVLMGISNFVESFTHLFEGYVDTKGNLERSQIMNTYKLAAFHTFFNVINVIIMLPLVNWLVKIATATVSYKDETDDHSLKFINSSFTSPEIATEQLQFEAVHFGEVAYKMSELTSKLINSIDLSERSKIYKKLKKYENITDRMEIEITEFITTLSNNELTPRTSIRLRSILNICNDLERIGDIYFQISKILEQKNDEGKYFTPDQRNNLNELSALIDKAFKIMLKNLNAVHYDKVEKIEALKIENEINKLNNKLRKNNLSKLGSDGYDVPTAILYNNIFSSLERIGDHIINVTESIIGEI